MIQEDLDVYLELFGSACTWTPPGGADVPLMLIVHDTRASQQDGEYQIRTREITAQGKTVDLSNVKKGDTLATTAERFVVEDSYPDDGNPDWTHLVLGLGG